MKNYDYYKQRYKSFTIKLHREADQDVILKLEQTESLPEYIRDLVRRDSNEALHTKND